MFMLVYVSVYGFIYISTHDLVNQGLFCFFKLIPYLSLLSNSLKFGFHSFWPTLVTLLMNLKNDKY